MSWWNAKYTNNNGEYEITFASKDYEKAKAVEKVCCAVMDKAVKSPLDVEVVVRCRECKHRSTEDCPMYFHSSYWHEGYEEYVDDDTDHTEDDYFCQEGERKEGADNG